LGVKDYSVGNHPLWQLFRTFYQMSQRPLVVGGLALGAGYAWSFVRRVEAPVPRDLVSFVRREQMQRLGKFLRGSTLAQSHRTASQEPQLATKNVSGEIEL